MVDKALLHCRVSHSSRCSPFPNVHWILIFTHPDCCPRALHITTGGASCGPLRALPRGRLPGEARFLSSVVDFQHTLFLITAAGGQPQFSGYSKMAPISSVFPGDFPLKGFGKYLFLPSPRVYSVLLLWGAVRPQLPDATCPYTREPAFHLDSRGHHCWFHPR